MNIRRISLKRGLKIKVSGIFTFFVVVVFFPPPIFERVSPFLDDLKRYFQLLVIAILFLDLFSKRKIQFSQSPIRWGLYCLYGLLLTLVFALEGMPQFLMRVVAPVFLSVLICMYYKNRSGGIQQLLDGMYYYWVTLIVLNCVMMILFPSGMIRSSGGSTQERANWLLGSKNNVVLPLLFASTIFMHRYLQLKKKNPVKLITFFCMVFFNLMWAGSDRVEAFGGSSTGLLALLAFLTMYFVGYLPIRKYLMRLSVGWFAWAFLLLSAVVVLGAITGNALIGSIFGAVGKDATASQRTYIWIDAITYTMQSPIFGRGYTIATLGSRHSQTYNLFLDGIYRYGLIGLALMLSAFGSYKPQIHTESRSNTLPKYIFLVGVVAMFVCSLVNTIKLEHMIVLLELYASVETPHDKDRRQLAYEEKF